MCTLQVLLVTDIDAPLLPSPAQCKSQIAFLFPANVKTALSHLYLYYCVDNSVVQRYQNLNNFVQLSSKFCVKIAAQVVLGCNL